MNHYEGWLYPKVGKSPYKVIDNPELINKKNKIRAVLREEYTKRMYNPYRMAAGVGGSPFDPAVIRYNAMMRTQTQFYRTGPRFALSSIFVLVCPCALFIWLNERYRRNRVYKIRTGQIAYADRDGKKYL